MEYRASDRLSFHPEAFRPSSSSSFPHQRWSSSSSSSLHPPHSSFYSSPQQINPCRHEPALDEPTRAYRTTALRQLNGNPKPLSWKARQAANNPNSSSNSSSSSSNSTSRSSTLASQPVLVRSYSGGPDDTSNSSKMPTRRSFPFTSSSNPPPRRGPELPSDEEFSIDSILRAIEPNIRSTLDSIGEICGRSKLSLANEYGSHIAPLGEIRAPPGGLLPVEEASPDHEVYTGENLVIYDDDNSAAEGRDHSPFSHYTFFDTLLPPISAPSGELHSTRDGSSVQAQPGTPRSLGGVEPTLSTLPETREFSSKPKADGRALLGSPAIDSGADDNNNRVQNILTPALVSEILLDAQANDQLLPRGGDDDSRTFNRKSSDSIRPSDMQSLFRWLRQAAWSDSTGVGQQTAEMRLRAMLERQTEFAHD